MLDIDALDRSDPLGEGEHLGLAKRLGREPTAGALVDHRGIQALLDRRPDGERRGEVVALDHQVGAVTHPDLVDPREEVICRVSSRDVREAWLDTHADEGHEPTVLPSRGLSELRVAETTTDFRVRLGWVRDRGVHRHVDVVTAGFEGRFENRRVEPRVAGVQHDIGPSLASEGGDGR